MNKKKRWTFMVKVFLQNSQTKEVMEAGRFEAAGISPYKIVAGANSNVMGSEELDHHASAMAMGDFISNIGDKNTLSVKKAQCPLTEYFYRSKNTAGTIRAVNLYVTPLSAVSKRLRGESRLNELEKNSLEWVSLKNVTVTAIWMEYFVNNKSLSIPYNYVTFETREKVKFAFKGKDW